ncbi:hypothetical protein BH09PSE1_BH09PSE1_08090 [soil metagenome]
MRGLLRAILLGGSRGGLSPPSGFVFLTDPDGAVLFDRDGAWLMEPI